MPHASNSLRGSHKLISRFTSFSFKHWKMISIVAVVFSCLSPLIIRGIRFETTSSINSAPNDPVSRMYTENLWRFGDSETFIIYLEFDEGSIDTVNLLTDALEKDLNSWDDISFVDSKPFDLNDTDTSSRMIGTILLNSNQALRSEFASRFSEEGMRRELRKTRRNLITLSDLSLRKMVVTDVLNVGEIILPFFENQMRNFKFSFLNGYFDALDGKARLIFVQPTGFSEDAQYCANFVTRMDRTITRIKKGIPKASSIRHSFSGKYAIIGESLQILQRDMKYITLAATGLILFLLCLVFRNIRVVLICFIPLIISMLAVLVVARVFFNPLNFMALGFVAILLGLGIDVSLHCTGRFFQTIEKSTSPVEAVSQVLSESGPPVVIGLSTTAMVFFCLVFAEYSALFQFGLLTALGLMITLTISLMLFPTTVRAFGPRQASTIKSVRYRRLPKWTSKALLSKPYLMIGIAVLFMISGIYVTRQFSFDMDIFVALPKKLSAFDAVGKLTQQFGSSFFMNSQITIVAEDMYTAMTAQKTLDTKLSEFIRDDRIDGFQSSSLFLPYPEGISDSSDMKKMARVIQKNRALFFDLLDELGFEENDVFQTYYNCLESAVVGKEEADILGFNDENSPPQLAKFMAEDNGKIFLQTYVWPKYNHIDHLPQDSKIFQDLESLAQQVNTELLVTGTFQVFDRIGKIVRWDFFRVSLISLAAVLGLLFLFFRNISGVLLSLLPLAGAVPFTLALVVLADVSFSPFLIGITAMIVGIGIDDSVHLLTRTRFGEKKSIKEVLPEIGPVIILTSFSTLIGFGALVFSLNRAVSSMGFLIAAGIFSCLLFTFMLIPSLLQILEKRK